MIKISDVTGFLSSCGVALHRDAQHPLYNDKDQRYIGTARKGNYEFDVEFHRDINAVCFHESERDYRWIRFFTYHARNTYDYKLAASHPHAEEWALERILSLANTEIYSALEAFKSHLVYQIKDWDDILQDLLANNGQKLCKDKQKLTETILSIWKVISLAVDLFCLVDSERGSVSDFLQMMYEIARVSEASGKDWKQYLSGLRVGDFFTEQSLDSSIAVYQDDKLVCRLRRDNNRNFVVTYAD